MEEDLKDLNLNEEDVLDQTDGDNLYNVQPAPVKKKTLNG